MRAIRRRRTVADLRGDKMEKLDVETRRGTILNGVLFPAKNSDTVVIAITGIHGNFYSNPFYYNIGDTLSAAGIDFIYAQTCDAFGEIETFNAKTGKKELIGSWNERFSYTDEDIDAYLDYAEKNYRHVILAGHSLGANKVIYYTAHDWLSGILDNVHTDFNADFSQVEQITHNGALIIGTYDNFTDGDPSKFLKNINNHMKTPENNKLIFIERTGHTYQQKHQEIAEIILNLAEEWRIN